MTSTQAFFRSVQDIFEYYLLMPSPGRVTRMDVTAAKEDLQNRTLAPIGYDVGRLFYLSSIKDYSSGKYHHHGLADSFSEQAARAALATCHLEVFYRLAICPLELLVAQIERFMTSTRQDLEKTVNAWESLEVYRLAVPSCCNPLTAALFRSNVKIAIALLKSRCPPRLEKAQSAWPRLSLGR